MIACVPRPTTLLGFGAGVLGLDRYLCRRKAKA
jgi:hypothetical protein